MITTYQQTICTMVLIESPSLAPRPILVVIDVDGEGM